MTEGGGEQAAVWRKGAWRWPGKKGGWRKVARQTTRIGGVKRTMLWVHPWGGESRVKISVDLEGEERWLLVTGGMKDRSPQWGKSPVMMEVEVDGKAAAARLYPNARGLSGFAVPLPEGAGEVSLLVGAKDNGRRHFFLDAETLR